MQDIKFLSKIERTPESGYVYVINFDNYYKIGKTINPEQRFGEYTLLPKEPTIICCESVNNYSAVEIELHNKYQNKLLRGEWYLLESEDIESIKSLLRKYKTEFPISKPKYEVQEVVKMIKKPLPKNRLKEHHEKEVLKMLLLYPATYLSLGILKGYMTNKNIVVKKGERFRGVDLASEMDITRQSASLHIQRLKELKIVKEVEHLGKKYYCLNPYYYTRGENNSVPENVEKAFEK